MNTLAILLAPAALLMPGLVPDAGTARLLPEEARAQAPSEPADREWMSMFDVSPDPVVNQVRIERRVTVRIGPISAVRRERAADMSRVPTAPRYFERAMGDCIKLDNIAAVQAIPGNRLLLHLRDRRLVTASLEKACRSQDFYSGFYVEPNEDRMVCVGRDRLQARTGASCEVGSMRQLIAIND